ncbi:hypothetical protein [Dietzia kunjamensis]|uniref:hypothetical protein n=1 Tax=Dietzia kunjamensis TaxID=322509 RepID=UPI0039BD72CB
MTSAGRGVSTGRSARRTPPSRPRPHPDHGDFEPEKYEDDYQLQLKELIEAKAAGGEAFTVAEREEARDDDGDDEVADLLAALRASVKGRGGDADSSDDDDDEDSASGKKSPARKSGSSSAKTEPAKKTASKKAPAKKAPAKKAAAKKEPAKKSAARKPPSPHWQPTAIDSPFSSTSPRMPGWRCWRCRDPRP